jgi:hypothetical protein
MIGTSVKIDDYDMLWIVTPLQYLCIARYYAAACQSKLIPMCSSACTFACFRFINLKQRQLSPYP